MKKIVIFMMILAILSGCSTTKQDKKTIHIALSLYDANDAFITEIAQQLEKLATEHVDENMVIDLYDGGGSQTLQNASMDEFIKKHYDMVWMNLVDRTAASTIIEKGRKADVPIVFFNREPVQSDMRLWNQVYYVGSKGEQSGILQGEIILEKYRKHPEEVDKNQDGILQYVILEGELGHQDASLRSDSCVKPFLEKGIPMERLDSEVANWKKAQGRQQMQNMLAQYKDEIEIVFSNNDEMALGAIEALDQTPYQAQVVGIDGTKEALEAIADHRLDGTVLNDATAQAGYIFEITRRQLAGESMRTLPFNDYNQIHVDFLKITPETITDIMKDKNLTF